MNTNIGMPLKHKAAFDYQLMLQQQLGPSHFCMIAMRCHHSALDTSSIQTEV
jgi:hypothetical protein